MPKLDPAELAELKPRITVVGVGGAGCNAINNMIATGLTGITYVAANTDAQALALSSAERRVQLGVTLTEGLGAGSKPEIGEAAAEEAIEELRAAIKGSHMVFIAAGMGGGTGTGAAAVIARIAREMQILTVAIVSKPFQFEGTRRMRTALQGIEELRHHVDTLIVIPNQNLFLVANDRTTFAQAFILADQVLYSGIACIVDLILKDGLINLDFADVRTVMADMGAAVMGTGEATGDRRATLAAEEAISNPLLEDATLAGARGVLLSILGGPGLTLYEVDEAASRVRQEVDPEANIIVGATFDESLGDRVRVSIVATGMGKPAAAPQVAAPAAALPSTVTTAPASPAQAPATASAPGPVTTPAAPPVVASQPPAQPATGQGRPPLPPTLPSTAPWPTHAPSQAVTPPPAPQRDPYLGDTDAEDFARALSEALSSSDPAPAPRPAKTAERDTWQAPGGVRIESGASGAVPPQARAYPPAQPAAQTRDVPPQPAAGFTPARPAPVPRQPSRIPPVESFPPVAQRAYQQARAQQVAAEERAAERTRRPSLLDMLTGRSRKSDSQPPAQPGYPQAGDGQRQRNVTPPAERGGQGSHGRSQSNSTQVDQPFDPEEFSRLSRGRS